MGSIAPRVPKEKIARLYALDARGIVDEALVEEVGYALLFRCESCLRAGRAKHGRAPCPACGRLMAHRGLSNRALLRCGDCGWSGRWKAYKAWHQGTWLAAEGLEEALRHYIDRFGRTKDARQRLVLIDTLIHRLHGQLGPDFRPETARVGALNLIEARDYAEIKAFLDGLAYGEQSSSPLLANRVRWTELMKRNRR